jgi:hypothetical protein
MPSDFVEDTRIARLRERCAGLLRDQSEDGWRNWTLGEPSHQAELYAGQPDLFTLANIQLVRELLAEPGAPPDRARQLDFLRLHLEREFIAQQAADLSDEIANRESEAEVEIGSERLPFRQFSVELAGAEDAERRNLLFQGADPVYEELNPLRERNENLYRQLAFELGYRDYLDLAQQQRQLDLQPLARTCSAILGRTLPLYRQLLAEELRTELGIVELERFSRADTARLLRCRRFDGWFPREGMLTALRQTLHRLGIELDSQSNIRLDVAERPKKIPRAVMFAVDAPADIRISVKPIGGCDDYAALFHEMGHAQHFAHVRETAWEFRNVGASNAVTETFAFLLEHVLQDADWLREHLDPSPDDLRRYLRSRAFRRLFMLRRYCAKLLYESHLHAEGLAGAPARYASSLAGALLYSPHPSEPLRYLADVDDLLYSADYLRAWFLEAQLVRELRRRFGQRWHGSPAAGDYLRKRWSVGQKYSGEEFAAEFGLGAIAPAALEAEIAALAA